MKVKTIQSLIDQIKESHNVLANMFHRGLRRSTDERVSGLLLYLYQHEKQLVKLVEKIEQKADSKALKTMMYTFDDALSDSVEKVKSINICALTYDEAVEVVIDIHNTILGQLEYLMGRSSIREELDMLNILMDAEQHELKQMVQQVQRGTDI